MQGPSSSAAMLHSEVMFQNRSAGKESPWESSQFSAVSSPSWHRMASHEQRCFLVKGMGHLCLGGSGSLIGIESLLVDPFPIPSFWPITAAIDRICIIDHDKVTVLDGMNLFCVHDKALPKPSGISTHSLNLRRIALRNEIMTPLSI